MPSDPRKRQKKLERRTAKRKQKKHLQVREQNAGVGERMLAASRHPIMDCLVTEDFWEQGMGWVLVSRQLSAGTVAVAVFLIDRYCLGVKNALADIVATSTYLREHLRKMHTTFTSREVTPEAARKLVESAVVYASNLGFPPHPDYHRAKLIFGDIDASKCTEEFEFGKDGKPFFIGGPNDTPERCQQILATLGRTAGQGNFHFMMPISPSAEVRELSDEEEGDDFPDDFDEESV